MASPLVSKDEVRLTKEECTTLVEDAIAKHAAYDRCRDILDWSNIVSGDANVTISTQDILRSQLAENMDPEVIIPRFMAAQKCRADGTPRFVGIKSSMDVSFEAFLKHDQLESWLRRVPKKTSQFPLKDSQILFMAFEAFAPIWGLPSPEIRLRYDTGFISNKKKLDGNTDEQLAEVPCSIPRGGAGVSFVNLPTGSGKTVCALGVVLLRLCNHNVWKWMLANREQLVRRAVTCSEGNGVAFQDISGITEMLRLGVVRCTSPAMQTHFQQQVALLLPCIVPLLDDTVNLEIWCGTVCDELKEVCADLPKVRALRGGSVDKAMHTKPDTAVVWFMSMDSSSNQKLRPKRGIPDDPWETLPCNCIIPVELLDEMTEASSSCLEKQDPVVLFRMVTNATPAKIISNGKVNKHHWFSSVIPAKTAVIMAQGNPGSREDIRSGFYGILKMSMITTPLSLVNMVGQDFVDDLPAGLTVIPVATRSLRMVQMQDNQDDLSQLSLMEFINRQFGWPLNDFSDVTDVISTISDDCSGCTQITDILPNIKSLIEICDDIIGDDTRRNAHKTAKLAQGQMQRFVDLVEDTDECPVCCEPMMEGEMCILGCCVTGLCNVCVDKIRATSNKCPNCRTPLDQSALVNHDPMMDAAGAEDAVEDDEESDDEDVDLISRIEDKVSELQINPKPFNDTLVELWNILKSDPVARVVLFCKDSYSHNTERRINDVLGPHPACPDQKVARSLKGAASDRDIVERYSNAASNQYPMIMLLENRGHSSTISGLDLPNTHAVISLKEPANAAQLVGRVFRPGGINKGNQVPLIVLK